MDRSLELVDETDTYIVRDVLTDDLVFVTPEDLPNHGSGDDDHIEESFSMEVMNSDDNQRLNRQFSEIIFIEDDEELENDDEYEQ